MTSVLTTETFVIRDIDQDIGNELVSVAFLPIDELNEHLEQILAPN